MNVPGLRILAPATPSDAYGLLRGAVRSDDPVLVFEDATLWSGREDLPEDRFEIPFGVARVVSTGSDVTLVAVSGSLRHAIRAAETVADDGVSVEVIDPRTLAPLDTETIARSVAKTGRLVVAEPAHRTCGAASEIITRICESSWGDLVAPPSRVTTPDVQIPFSPALEKPLYPNETSIADELRASVRTETPS